MACGLAIGGWCPPGRVSEVGTIPDIFQLKETPEERSQDALDIPRSQRTEWSVRDSDATLVLCPGTFDKRDLGTRYTIDCALRYKKYLLICDPTEQHQVDKAIDWITRHNIRQKCISMKAQRLSAQDGAVARNPTGPLPSAPASPCQERGKEAG
jgi:Circularly permutated YpsA SLOG family